MALTVNITHTAMPTKCPACLDHLAKGPAIERCPECNAPHHGECLSEIGCSSLVCTATSAPGAGTDTGYGPGFLAEEDLAGHPNPLAEAVGEGEGGYYGCSYDVGIGAWSLPYCDDGSSYGDTLERANYATLEAEFGGDPCHCDLIGAFCDGHPNDNPTACSFWHNGTFQVLRQPCQCSEDNEPWDCEARAVETMGTLEEYPVLDDCLHSNAECHDQEEQWESYGRSDFASELEKLSGLEEGQDGYDSDKLDELRILASDETGAYTEGSDDSLSFPLEEWAEWIIGNADLDLTEYGFRHPMVDHPLAPRSVLSMGNIVGAERAADSLPQGRPDTPETRRMVARAVCGAFSRHCRRLRSQRTYRRLAYRIAIEHYLKAGPA